MAEQTRVREAIALVETISVAIGVRVADEMAKRAPVEILEATPICPGKYMVLVAGDVASVEASLRRGVEAGGDVVVDTLFIPNVDAQVFPAILGATAVGALSSLGVVETFTAASTILCADAAAKAASVRLIEIRLAKGLGGKAFFTMTGELHEVEAAMDAAVAVARAGGNLVRSVVIPRPHDAIAAKVL
ncbi:MAG: BMC domain-containing protein [Candidatus Eisenbacteria bacterium]|nr:BMC domain-containing protein [Candidatus Eisenbacteria bacterium]